VPPAGSGLLPWTSPAQDGPKWRCPHTILLSLNPDQMAVGAAVASRTSRLVGDTFATDRALPCFAPGQLRQPTLPTITIRLAHQGGRRTVVGRLELRPASYKVTWSRLCS
jgi:hypothetical protein